MTQPIYWTGVGSRKVSDFHSNMMYIIGERLAKRGMILRSGKAAGSDAAFQRGAQSGGGEMEIYVPWNNMNKSDETLSDDYDLNPFAFNPRLANSAYDIMKEIHPNYKALTPAGAKLHTRNIFQVLGVDLKTPSRVLVACSEPTKDGVKGGTNTAWQLAKLYGIPCINLWPVYNHNLISIDEIVDEILFAMQ